jgi:hypothetical protein
MATSAGGVLWVTVPGATRAPLLAWAAWLVFAAVGAPLLAERIGPAGAAILVVGAGWIFARRIPPPIERLRHYHLDDTEVTVIGPGGRVLRHRGVRRRASPGPRRSPCTVRGCGSRSRCCLVGRGIWAPVLARMVPRGRGPLGAARRAKVDLVPGGRLARARVLAWGPAAVAACSASGPWGSPSPSRSRSSARGGARPRAHRRGHAPACGPRAAKRPPRRVRLLAARRGDARRVHGLLFGPSDGRCGRVGRRSRTLRRGARRSARSFRDAHHAHVSFRARIAEGRLAVVGEVEPSA